MGCALGAIVGNFLFLRSTETMLACCSLTCAGVLAALVASRRSVFSEDDLGCLVRRLDGRCNPRISGEIRTRIDGGTANAPTESLIAENAAVYTSKAKALQRRSGPAGKEGATAFSV